MNLSSVLFFAILITSLTSAPVYADSVPKIGNTCPQGYHPSGSSGYCVPFRQNAPKVVPKIGNTCPTGYHTDGTSGYCAPFDSTRQKELIPKRGSTCPSGYHTDGTSGYCRQN